MKTDKTDIKLNKELANKAWASYTSIVYEPFVDIIANIVQKNHYKSIAEIGCGHGKTGYYLRKVFKIKKLELKATEISEVAKKKSEKYYDEITIRSDYKLPEGNFDLVLLTSVIEHVYDQNLNTLFTDITKKLKPGGSVFVVVPNIHSPVFLMTDSKESQKKRMGHVNLKSKSEWELFFKKHGFTKIRYSFFESLPNIKDLLLFKSKWKNFLLRSVYRLLNIYPFYNLKNSYWILLQK